MSFFSGFTISPTFGKMYETSISEVLATNSNIIVGLFCSYSLFKDISSGNNYFIQTSINIIFLILSIVALVIYYINKNQIIKVYQENADEELNKIYFSSSLVGAILYIIISTITYK
jgi:hypothetical protein